MRAARVAGREVFGYNRSVEGVQAARSDGFDATESLEEALDRAAESQALIVLAVPVPALPMLLSTRASPTPVPSCSATSASRRQRTAR